jgi:hypothetical protein
MVTMARSSAAAGVEQGGADVVGLQEREFGEQLGLAHPGRQIVEQMLHREPLAANDGLAAEDDGVGGDAGEEGVGHGGTIAQFAETRAVARTAGFSRQRRPKAG